MKRFRTCLTLAAFAIAVLFAGCSKHTGKDNVRQADIGFIAHIQEIAITRPEEALALLDTAESRHRLSAFDINDLRSLVYHNGLSRYKTALAYARKAYNDPEAKKKPKRLLSLVSIMADEAHTNGDYAGSIRYCTEGLDLARKLENRTYEAGLNVTWGLNLMEMGQYDEAFRHIDMAIGILDKEVRKNPRYHAWDELLYALGMKLSLLWDKDRYEEAIAMKPLIEEALHGLEKSDGIPDGLADMRKAETDAIYCCIAYATSDRTEGDRLYRQIEANPASSAPEKEYIRILCLNMAGRHQEALHYIRREKEMLRASTDTVNWDYINPHLQSELEAYQGIGDWKSASRVQSMMLALTDSLRQRERTRDALELAEIYNSSEQALQIERQANKIRRHNIFFAFAIPAFILLAAILVYVLKSRRIIERKNDAMKKAIDELIACKDGLFEKQEENMRLREKLESSDRQSDQEKDRMLFEHVNHEIVSRKLYLQSDFSKKELLKGVHIPANKFASLFREFAGCSFSQYIQDLRLDYAIRLMREQPQWTLDAIAKEASMSNGAFYSQFQKKYGMKPSEFRKRELFAPPIDKND